MGDKFNFKNLQCALQAIREATEKESQCRGDLLVNPKIPTVLTITGADSPKWFKPLLTSFGKAFKQTRSHEWSMFTQTLMQMPSCQNLAAESEFEWLKFKPNFVKADKFKHLAEK